MARQGYLILDSDLHMMEPDDLWACYLDEPYEGTPRVSSGCNSSNSPKILRTKPTPMSSSHPAHGKLPGAAASRNKHYGPSIRRKRGKHVRTRTCCELLLIGTVRLHSPNVKCAAFVRIVDKLTVGCPNHSLKMLVQTYFGFQLVGAAAVSAGQDPDLARRP